MEELIVHLKYMKKLTGRPFYENAQYNLKQKDYHEIVTYDVLFLIDAYFNDGFRHVTWEEIQGCTYVLDFLEGILVMQILAEEDEETRNDLAEISREFSRYRNNHNQFLKGEVFYNKTIEKWRPVRYTCV